MTDGAGCCITANASWGLLPTFAGIRTEGDVADWVLPQRPVRTVHNRPVLAVAGGSLQGNGIRTAAGGLPSCHGAASTATASGQPDGHRALCRTALPPPSFSFPPVNFSSSPPFTSGPVTLLPPPRRSKFCGSRQEGTEGGLQLASMHTDVWA